MTTNSKSINISINEKYLEGKEDNFDIYLYLEERT